MFRNLTPVVKTLLLFNVAMFVVASYVIPQLDSIFALYFIQSSRFMPTQFVTYMFMHANGWHLFSNMFGLFVFGPLLEQYLGPKKNPTFMDGMRYRQWITLLGVQCIQN